MRRVWTTYGMLPLVLLIAASLVFISRGANQADASPWAPTLTTTLGSTAPGTDATIAASLSFGNFPSATRNFPNNFPLFTPGDWGMSTAASFADGTTTGSATAILTLGLLNSACAINLPTPFPALLDSSVDSSAGNTIAVTPGFASLIADVAPANGVMDGVEHWHTLLVALGLPPARERQAASASVLGTAVWLDILTFNPGTVAPAALGFSTLVVIENFNPAAPAAPSLITDTCGVSTTVTQLGNVGGTSHRTNPAVPGQKLFFMNSGSDRDADQGTAVGPEPTLLAPSPPLPPNVIGFVNDDDTCPYTPNLGSPYQPVSPFNGDGLESPGDGIDYACDPAPDVFSGSDFDLDAYLNRQDNCPLVSNGVLGTNQVDASEIAGPPAANEVGPQPVDGGPTNDDIGDDCDLNLAVPDGHFHTALNVSAQCIGAPDGDGDGYCDLTELGLGSSDTSAASTPEALAIPTTCSDGADNDGDAATDLGDSGCLGTQHDIAWKQNNPFSGNGIVCGVSNPPNTGVYHAKARSVTTGPHPGQMSVYIDPVPGTGGSGASVSFFTSNTPFSVTGSGPINIDGDTDVEWLLKALVEVKANGNTNVEFHVTYPACGGGPNVSPVDYNVSTDICHGDDIAPLGVSPQFGACGAAADGGQDAASANDSTLSQAVNDESK